MADGRGARREVATPPTVPGPLPYDRRPTDDSPIDTDGLPDLPQRDRNIPASAWRQAPASLQALGADLPGAPVAVYKRRIGTWLLWRAGPARRARARYWAAHADDLSAVHVFELDAEGGGSGVGPSGAIHTRFRTWKEDLRDHPHR